MRILQLAQVTISNLGWLSHMLRKNNHVDQRVWVVTIFVQGLLQGCFSLFVLGLPDETGGLPVQQHACAGMFVYHVL